MVILKTSDLLLWYQKPGFLLFHSCWSNDKTQRSQRSWLLHRNSMVISQHFLIQCRYFSQHIVPENPMYQPLLSAMKIEMKFALQPSEEMCRWSDNYTFYNRWMEGSLWAPCSWSCNLAFSAPNTAWYIGGNREEDISHKLFPFYEMCTIFEIKISSQL